jgi:transposase
MSSESKALARQPGKSGKPSRLTPEVSAKIEQALRAGNYMETAAAYAGIPRSDLYAWLKRGREESSGIYFDFCKRCELAFAAAEIRDLALIAQAATSQWQAAAWRLERRYPDKWGRRERLAVTDGEGRPITTGVIILPPEREGE